MKRLIIGWICAIWCLHAACADAASSALPVKKGEASQSPNIPWDELDERATGLARQMLEKPTVFARGPQETFPCSPNQYYWLLENPDRVVTAWRRLGAKCVNITARGPGRFGYSDELGSDLVWQTIHDSREVRIWMAEGKVKPGVALPTVSVKALVVLHHQENKSDDGVTFIKHRSEVVIHTDSRAAATVTKMMGQSATKLAEQGAAQLQLFFSALSSYVERHPDQAEALFRPENVQAIQRTGKTGN